MFFDFRKSFDTILHPELLFKLWFHGITGPLWHWFKTYLSNHVHYVSVEGFSSNALPVQSGASQGSVLSPLLFLIYINDIPNATTFCQPYFFADDTKLTKSICHPSSSTHLQQYLDSIAQWCANWKLSINSSKCASLHFFLSLSTPHVYYIECQPIKEVVQYKDLSILVQIDLSWSKHIDIICAKAYSVIIGVHTWMLHSQINTQLSYQKHRGC